MTKSMTYNLVTKVFFDDVLTAAGAGIYGVDLEGRTTFINPAAAQMLGYPAHELIGRPHHDITHHTRADGTPYPAEDCPIHSVLRDGTVHRVDDELFWRKDGTSFPVEYVATPIRKGGKNTGAVVVFRDVTERREAEAEILRQKANAERYLDIAGSVLLALDREGRITLANRRCNKVLGYAEGELIGRDWFETCLPLEIADTVRGVFNQVISGEIEGDEYFENEVLTKSGARRLIAWQNRNLLDDNGVPIGTLSSGEDVTEQRLAERELAEKHSILEVVDRTLSRFIKHRDSRKNFDEVLVDLLDLTNSQCGFICEYQAGPEGACCLQPLALSNISRGEGAHQSDHDSLTKSCRFDDFDALYAAAVTTGDAVFKDGPDSTELPDGHIPLVTFLGVPLKRGKTIVGTVGLANRPGGYDRTLFENLTPLWSALAEIIEVQKIDQARKEAQRESEHLAHYDVLTGLPNRIMFREQLDWALRQQPRYDQPFALLLLDLDHFKDVNDALGHLAGDALLIAIAKRLKSNVRASDIVARIGSDEYAILQLGFKGPDTAAALAQRICTNIAKPFDIDGSQIHTGISVGIAICSQAKGETCAEALFKEADTALHRVKAEDPGGFRFYDPKMEAEVRQRVEIIEDLHRAITEKQFCLFYQPQIDIVEKRLVGCEALIRWNHPERGLIPPDVFIPVAEESGQLIAIDDWVLNEACQQMHAWQVRGLMPADAAVAVNLTPLQFKSAGFEARIIAALERSKLDPHHLEMEITERIMAEHPDKVAKIMLRLNQRGIRFSIDDFGTGYSSLQYLKTMPVNKLKIAQEFVHEALQDVKSAAIVNAIIGLGKEFGLQVVAEGVETAEQLAYLREKSCAIIQGYHFSKPEPPGRFEKWASEELPGLIGQIPCGHT